MKNIWFPVVLASLVWNACSPVEFPDGVQDNPVFSMSLDSQYQWVAGLNDCYLFTQVNTPLPDSILQFSGAFADRLCPTGDCSNSIRFEFLNNTYENFAEPDFLFGPNMDWRYRFDPNVDKLGTVAVQLVLKEGALYRSDLLMQEDSNFVGHFFIESSEPWEKNERGEQAWKMTVNFQCRMLNPQTQDIQIIQGQGVIGVAYQ